MDFLAGAMTGLSITAFFFVMLVMGTMNAIMVRMKSLEEAVTTRIKKEIEDDADYWKRGYENDDEV